LRALIASLVLLLGSSPSLVRAASAPQAIVPATQVITFHPSGATGAAVKGNCWTESIALERTDAWCCMVGNAIFDPCFSATPHAMSVICDAYPTHPVGTRVTLSSPLPAHSVPHGTRAWSLVLGRVMHIMGMLRAVVYQEGVRPYRSQGPTNGRHGAHLPEQDRPDQR
jgi:hypothetical protein